MTVPDLKVMAWVYALYCPCGDLAYVGVTKNLPERLEYHRKAGDEFATFRAWPKRDVLTAEMAAGTAVAERRPCWSAEVFSQRLRVSPLFRLRVRGPRLQSVPCPNGHHGGACQRRKRKAEREAYRAAHGHGGRRVSPERPV